MSSTQKTLFRLAHISDLHFSKLTWEPSQLFSKRWLGNLNVLFSRKKAFDADNLTTLFPVFHEKKINTVLITGDLSSTSHKEEFALAKQFVDNLKREGFKVFTLPGNHDHYTRNAYKTKLFYNFFDSQYDTHSEVTLKNDGVTTTRLGENWWLVALDTAIATSLLSSNGLFSSEIELRLEEVLNKIPSGHAVILMNHFPIFSNESSRKSLLRKEALKQLLERHSKVKLFLHGHTHRHCIADLRNSHLPIMLDSGSTALKTQGSWNLITITTQGCLIEGFKTKNREDYTSWEPFTKSTFNWCENEALV